MDYVGRAIHAIETGQPNLAMLYMRRGLSERADVPFPDHLWFSAPRSLACSTCPPGSPWRFDKVAHNLGETQRLLRILDWAAEAA